METTIHEVLDFVQENDVKFIRLAFCDIFGNQKNIAIMPTELPRAFTHGIHFDASALKGFLNVEASDLLLFPDPGTLSLLPWRPAQGRVIRFYCDIKYPDGTPFEGDGRHILREAIARAKSLGYSFAMGTSSEFYLFEMDEKGRPTFIPHDFGEYFDVAPLDKGENVRRQICLTLEEMGIQPESSHHEEGPSQHQIDFKYADIMEAADNFVTFKWVVKSAASSNGLYASFMPKPLRDAQGNGLHLSFSITKGGKNLFEPTFGDSIEGQQFVAGLLRYVEEISAFGNPLTNSYARLGYFKAPKYITWSYQNRSPLLTVPITASGAPARIQMRAFDGCINPYIVFALLIHAGLNGIEEQMTLASSCNVNLFTAAREITSQYDALPASLADAIKIARESALIQSIIPERTREVYFASKLAESNELHTAPDLLTAEREYYFERY